MTAFAALGAILTLSQQRFSTRRQMFIATFVGMMERLQQTVQDTDYSVVRRTPRDDGLVDEQLVVVQSGQNAFFEIAQELRLFITSRKTSNTPPAAFEGMAIVLYEAFYDDYKDALGHYFRQVYHILKYIDESRERDRARFAKILRASFTNSQMLLLAYNAVSGEGRIKFSKLIRDYSLLHNLGFEHDELGRLEKRLIVDRVGVKALESQSQREDLEDEQFQLCEAANLRAREAYREYLLSNDLSTDVGAPWLPQMRG